MGKLYPPSIEGTLPASYNGRLVVPYIMNKSVSYDEISKFQIKINTVYNNALIGTLSTTLYDDNYVYFDFEPELVKVNVGQSYKVQLAYVDKDNIIGYYSTVGVVKYTALPIVEIKDLILNGSNGEININPYKFVAKYTSADSTEKPYLYQFDLYDRDKNLLISSGEQFNDTYELTYQLQEWFQYYIKLIITTANGVTAESGYYRIMEAPNVNVDNHMKLEVNNGILMFNGDIGYYKILRVEEAVFQNDTNKYREDTPAKAKSAVASDAETPFRQWQDVHHFAITNLNDFYTWFDTTTEAGKSYQYCVQQYGVSRLSQRSEIVKVEAVELEDAELIDADKRFIIKYNPKINNFKNTLLESKVDTIGGKFPFIFRNGEVKYKEFAISGLITLAKETNLTVENHNVERDYRLEMLDWLNNGKAKIYRSTPEGNYIVRLLNVSLTPEQKLGRLIGTFSATAYEIADYNYKNLKKYNFFNLDNLDYKLERKIEYYPKSNDIEKELLQSSNCYNLKLVNFPFGTEVLINGNEHFRIRDSKILDLSGQTISSLKLTYFPMNENTVPYISYNYKSSIYNELLDTPESKTIIDNPYVEINSDDKLDNKQIYYYKIFDISGKELGYYNYYTREQKGETLPLSKDETAIISYYGG